MVNFECDLPYRFDDLCRLMAILRSDKGCIWDREQTHTSIRDNMLEEACEAQEAIDIGDKELLCEELGDVLLQVVFHAQMATEENSFTMDDVINTLCTKLIERHPHVFGDTEASNTTDVLANWESIKRKTKGQASVYESMKKVSTALPQTMRARKLIKLADRSELKLSPDKLKEAIALAEQLERALNDACNTFIEQAKDFA